MSRVSPDKQIVAMKRPRAASVEGAARKHTSATAVKVKVAVLYKGGFTVAYIRGVDRICGLAGSVQVSVEVSGERLPEREVTMVSGSPFSQRPTASGEGRNCHG